MPKSFTTPIYTSRLAVLQPEYATVKSVASVFGLSRTEPWRLMDAGQIRLIHYKSNPDSAKGVRLIELSSLRAYIETFAK